MSDDLPEFTLFYYYDASVEEIIKFLNIHSLQEIKYHVKMLENIESFNHFFKRYKHIKLYEVNDVNKLRYLYQYYNYLWRTGKLSYYRH